MIIAQPRAVEGLRLQVEVSGEEVGHAYLYLLRNDLHTRPYGYMEDVFVAKQYRGEGVGTRLVERVIEEARRRNCYKLVGCSRYERPHVHRIYLGFGFEDHGKEFRLDL